MSPTQPRALMEPGTLCDSLARAGLRDSSQAPLVVERGWPLVKIPLMLRCSDPEIEGKRRRWWSFFFLDSQEVPYICRASLKARNAVYLPDLQAVVQVFPRDLLLEGVDEALSKRTAAPVLAAAIDQPDLGRGSLTARPLSYKPSRRLTVRYRFSRTGERGRTLFGKLLPPGADRHVLQIQEVLEQSVGLSADDRFSTPRLAGRVPSWNALVWRKAPGQSLFELLRSPQLEHHVAHAARCLAGLHGSASSWERVHDRDRELSTTHGWVRAAMFAEPSAGVGYVQGYQRLMEAMPRAASASLVPSHRDFYDRQILLDEHRCTLLDLEVASQAEPELDVANFLAHLELRCLQGRLGPAQSVTEIFEREYASEGPSLDRARLRWYLASSLLRLACVYSLRPQWSNLSPSLLQASVEAIEGERTLWRVSA